MKIILRSFFAPVYTVCLKSSEILTNFINKNGIFWEFSNFSKILQMQSDWGLSNINFF